MLNFKYARMLSRGSIEISGSILEQVIRWTEGSTFFPQSITPYVYVRQACHLWLQQGLLGSKKSKAQGNNECVHRNTVYLLSSRAASARTLSGTPKKFSSYLGWSWVSPHQPDAVHRRLLLRPASLHRVKPPSGVVAPPQQVLGWDLLVPRYVPSSNLIILVNSSLSINHQQNIERRYIIHLAHKTERESYNNKNRSIERSTYRRNS